ALTGDCATQHSAGLSRSDKKGGRLDSRPPFSLAYLIYAAWRSSKYSSYTDMFLPKETAAARAPQTRCIQRHGSRVVLYSSTIDWWCLKACISVKLSWQTISARRAMRACGS